MPPLRTLLRTARQALSRSARTPRRARLAAASLVLLPTTASCVPSAGAPLALTASAATAPAPTGSTPADAAVIASFTAPPAAATDPASDSPAQIPTGAAPAANAAIPFAPGANAPAAPFFLRARASADTYRSLQCLTEAIYYEAASETDDGQRAVAQVVLNRMRHPAFPASVCGVVYQNAQAWLACQFSFACDGARARVPSADGWARARLHASAALAGRVFAPVGTATHYHTWNVVPFWAHKLEKSAVVGMHIFYRLNGALGRGPAFRQRYAGFEPMPVPVRVASPAPLLAIVPLETAVIAPAAPAKSAVRTDAVPLPTPDLVTAPKPAPSPIMRAVEGSTVRDAYRNSGTLRPEFAAR